MIIFGEISQYLQKGDVLELQIAVERALAMGLDPRDILQSGLLAGMRTIGTKFKKNEVFVPEVLIASRAMKAGMDKLKPYLAPPHTYTIGKIVLGTVQGDLHDIGKNLVKMELECAGFEVIDLGVEVSTEEFLKAVREHRPQIFAMSALLTTTMQEMGKNIKALEGLRKHLKVMVGGAPITENFAREIGADVYCQDAKTAAQAAQDLLATIH